MKTGEQSESVNDLSNQITQSRGFEIVGRLKLLDLNYFIFEENYNELMLWLHEFSKPERIPILMNSDESNRILYHLTRFLQNYVASAKSLVDHTRILINEWYKKHPFKEEYQNEIKKRFLENELSLFIEDFRNYILHISLPSCGLTVRLESNQDITNKNITFFIEKKELLKWSGWSKGRKFLDNYEEDNIRIEKLVFEYYSQISDFHKWMYKSLEDIHKNVLEDLLFFNFENEPILTSKMHPPLPIVPKN